MNSEITTWSNQKAWRKNGQQSNVLIVDSSATTRILVANMFIDCGIDADTAGDSTEAVLKYRIFNFDMVIVEVNMEALAGIHIAKAIRNAPTSSENPLLIYALTDNERQESIKKMKDAMMDGFLRKPITIEAIEKIAKHHCLSSEY